MQIEEAIYKLLKTSGTVTDLVVGRIFAGVIPQENHTWPALCYRAPADTGRGREVIRVLEGGCTLVRQRIQIFSAGRTYGAASTLDQAVSSVLDEFRGTVVKDATSPEESIDIQGIFLAPRGNGLAHAYQYVDKTKLHEFISEFDCNFTDLTRISD